MTKKRIYNSSIPVIGLTGSIATGKTSFSNILTKYNQPVICADQLVKKIYEKETSKIFLKNINPLFVDEKGINFKFLRESFFNSGSLKSKIETFIYGKLENEFRSRVENINSKYVIYDVPLLFEKNIQSDVDSIVLVHCSQGEQLKRLIKRDNISKDMALKMINSQISTKDKALKSDLVIENERELVDLDIEYNQKFLPFIKDFLKKNSSDLHG